MSDPSTLSGEPQRGGSPLRVFIDNSASSPALIAVRGGGALTDRSGTIDTGAQSQVLAAANPARKYLLILNLSTETLWVNFGIDAVASQPSIPLAPAPSGQPAGGGLIWESNFIPTDSVHIIGATRGDAFVAKEG